MNNEFIVTNNLEQSLIDIRKGKILLPEFIKVFLESELIIPSAAEMHENGLIVPLLFNKEDQSMLSVFTSLPLIEIYKRDIKHYLIMDGRNMLMQMPTEIGLVINPGYSVGFDISVEGIKNVINDYIMVDKR